MSIITTKPLTIALDKQRVTLPGVFGALCGIQAPPSLGRFNILNDGVVLGASDAYGRFMVHMPSVDFVRAGHVEIDFFETEQFNSMLAVVKYADQAYGNIIDPAIQCQPGGTAANYALQTTVSVLHRCLVVRDTPPGYVYARQLV